MSETHRLPWFLRAALARQLARPATPAGPARRRRRCIYKVDRIGDFVLATGAIRTLLALGGSEETRLVVSEAAAPVARHLFPDVDVWELPNAANGVWRDLRPLRRRLAPALATERFADLVVLRHARSLYRDVSLAWLEADEAFALEPRPSRPCLDNRPLLPSTYPASAMRPWCRELRAHAQVLQQKLGRDPGWDEVAPVLPAAAAIKADVVLCPVGGERIRDYPTSSWVSACRDALPAGTPIHVAGPAGRGADLAALAGRLRESGFGVRVSTDLPPVEFLQTVASARLVLTIESAAAHIATACDRPAVIIMGGGHFGWFAPWGSSPRQRWVHVPISCYGCNWVCRRERVECLEGIEASRVARAIGEALNHG